MERSLDYARDDNEGNIRLSQAPHVISTKRSAWRDLSTTLEMTKGGAIEMTRRRGLEMAKSKIN